MSEQAENARAWITLILMVSLFLTSLGMFGTGHNMEGVIALGIVYIGAIIDRP